MANVAHVSLLAALTILCYQCSIHDASASPSNNFGSFTAFVSSFHFLASLHISKRKNHSRTLLDANGLQTVRVKQRTRVVRAFHVMDVVMRCHCHLPLPTSTMECLLQLGGSCAAPRSLSESGRQLERGKTDPQRKQVSIGMAGDIT